MIAYGGERLVIEEDLLHGFTLHISVLYAEQTSRSQQTRGLCDHCPNRIQPILARDQGKDRIMITHLGYHRLESVQWDVGRVGDY